MAGGGSDPTAGSSGGPGGAPGGGSGRTSFPVLRISREDSMRNTLLTSEVREPAALPDDCRDRRRSGHHARKRTAAHAAPHRQGRTPAARGVTVATTTTRDAGRLVVRYKVDQQHELRYTYSRVDSPPQLVVDVQFVQRGGGDTVRRVYEPAGETERPADAAAPRQAAAPPSAGQAAAPPPEVAEYRRPGLAAAHRTTTAGRGPSSGD